MYSQNNEEQIIKGYFGNFKGHLLSLGENDGITLSNSRALIENGWSADLVEPAPRPFAKLCRLYDEMVYGGKKFPFVKLHNKAIGVTSGKFAFYESGTLLKSGDTDLVSTLSTQETLRWNGAVDFNTIEVDVITFQHLIEHTFMSTFDFISIDCEGFDLLIFRQMNLVDLQCKMVCVEFNGKDQYWFDQHAKQFGMRLLHKNAENLIYAR